MQLMFIDTHIAEEIVLNIGKHTEPLLSFSSSIITTYATKKISKTNPNKLYIQFIGNWFHSVSLDSIYFCHNLFQTLWFNVDKNIYFNQSSSRLMLFFTKIS